MIIIRIQGGLGNQLFQYALYESFKGMGKEVRADITNYQRDEEERKLELTKLGIEVKAASRDELHNYYADNSLWSDRVLRYIIGKKRYIKEKDYDFTPEILELTDAYLSGYWQCEKYFNEVRKRIRNNIVFQNVLSDRIELKRREIEGHNSVSVHIRMGDYLQHSEMYGNICTREYYSKALDYMMKHVENPVFYIFSDEPDKAERMLSGYNYCLLTENSGDNSYKDMYLMSRCRHHIIANSTFSWWGAWLDEKDNQIVITPSKWNNFCKTNGICCKGWIML